MSHATLHREAAPRLPRHIQCTLPYPRFVTAVHGYRMHYVDVGEGPVVLMQHGNPMWCFLWRKVIAQLQNHPVRVIAPDLIGLGLSDRPRHPSEHTLDFHASNLQALIEGLDLRNVTIVGQDWGGPVTAVAASRLPERVQGAVFANTSIVAPEKQTRVTTFHRISRIPVLSDLLFTGLGFPLPVLHKVQGNPASIGRVEKEAYRYPLRRWRDRAAMLALAQMVPTDPDHPSVPTLHETDDWAQNEHFPVELVWGTRDPIMGPAIKAMKRRFPHAPVTETHAGHFLQEEVPQLLAEAILRVVEQG